MRSSQRDYDATIIRSTPSGSSPRIVTTQVSPRKTPKFSPSHSSTFTTNAIVHHSSDFRELHATSNRNKSFVSGTRKIFEDIANSRPTSPDNQRVRPRVPNSRPTSPENQPMLHKVSNSMPTSLENLTALPMDFDMNDLATSCNKVRHEEPTPSFPSKPHGKNNTAHVSTMSEQCNISYVTMELKSPSVEGTPKETPQCPEHPDITHKEAFSPTHKLSIKQELVWDISTPERPYEPESDVSAYFTPLSMGDVFNPHGPQVPSDDGDVLKTIAHNTTCHETPSADCDRVSFNTSAPCELKVIMEPTNVPNEPTSPTENTSSPNTVESVTTLRCNNTNEDINENAATTDANITSTQRPPEKILLYLTSTPIEDKTMVKSDKPSAEKSGKVEEAKTPARKTSKDNTKKHKKSNSSGGSEDKQSDKTNQVKSKARSSYNGVVKLFSPKLGRKASAKNASGGDKKN